MRSRIHEEFTEEDIEFIDDICNSPYFDNTNDKADALMARFRNKNFIELAPATNRLAILKGEYVYKFALDNHGIDDNWAEFYMSPKLQPYATKTYESNGLITIAEYVHVMKNKDIFRLSEANIKNILRVLAEDFIFADVGTITKNFCNWGYRDDNSLVILDYGYFYDKDPKIMFCSKCGGSLHYDYNFDKLECEKCHKKYMATDILYRMQCNEEDFANNDFNIKGPLVIELG